MKEKYMIQAAEESSAFVYLDAKSPTSRSYRSDDTWYGGTYGAL